MGNRKLDPIAPRRALGEKGSAVALVAMTPVAPAASAARTIAPTLTGLLMLCITTSKGTAGCLAFKLAFSSAGRDASTTIPFGGFVLEVYFSNFSLTHAAFAPAFLRVFTSCVGRPFWANLVE